MNENKDKTNKTEIAALEPEFQIGWHLQDAQGRLQEVRETTGRSKIARQYAITITELEKVIAYYDYYIFRG